MSPVEWLDHTADVGFRATAESLDAVFCEASRALFSLMFDIKAIGEQTRYPIALSAPSLEHLLVEWLSELLVQKDLTRLVFRRYELAIAGDVACGFSAVGTAFGEELDHKRHKPGTEVKGISYLGLNVSQCDGMWVAQVIVDV